MAGTLSVSVVKNDTTSPPAFQNSAGVEIGQLCRAWVNFNGSGGATINASFNVSSVVRNAVGDYTINFTTAMPDANYSAVAMIRAQASGAVTPMSVNQHFDTAPTASAVRVRTSQGATAVDGLTVHFAAFR